MLVLFLLVIVIASIVGIYLSVYKSFAPHKNSLLDYRGSPPRIISYSGTIINPRILGDSDDAGGYIVGEFSGAGNFEVVVQFATTYTIYPRTISLTPTALTSGNPSIGYVLSVDNLSQTGFEVIGYTPEARSDSILFYYLVI